MLSQLALSVEALAGKEAVGRLHVVLHVNEEQAEDVAEELHRHHSYGCVSSLAGHGTRCLGAVCIEHESQSCWECIQTARS